MFDHGLIGEADEADVLVDLEFLFSGVFDGIERDVVVETEHGRRSSFELEEFCHGPFGAFFCKIGGDDQAGIEFEGVAFEAFSIAGDSLFAAIQLFGPVEHPDGTMPILQEVFYCLGRPRLHVAGDVMDIGQIGYPVEEHNGNAVAF